MKKIKIFLILVFVCVSFILIGCVNKNEIAILNQGSNQDIIKVENKIIEGETTFTQIKVELEDFKSFSEEFFPIWMDNKNTIKPMVEDFNNSSRLKEKIESAKLLEEKYLEFKFNLENIKPPLIAFQANKLAVESVSYRVLFFKKFYENTSMDELNKIENQAFSVETRLWDEIDRIYKYFDEKIARLGIESDYKYIVLK